MADGARTRLTVEEVEVSSLLASLVEHATELLQEQLDANPWYKEPLSLAIDRIHQHLRSDQLQIEINLAASAAGSPSDGTSAALEGAADGATAVSFKNEINLMDFVADVQEIYRAFTGTITAQTSTFASALKKVAPT